MRDLGWARLSRLVLAVGFLLSGWLLRGEAAGPAQPPETPLRLRSGQVDPLAGGLGAPAAPAPALPDGGALRLVQFPGPVQPEWRAALEAAGLRVVAYIPENAYLVWARPGQIEALAASAPLRWSGEYRPTYALHPALAARAAAQAEAPVEVNLQMVALPELAPTLELIRKESLDVLAAPRPQPGGTLALGLRLPAGRLGWLAQQPGVVDVEPRLAPRKQDEIQGQIIAGALDGSGAQPNGPGYLAWLTALGFSTNPTDYPIVDVTDDGIDDGSATPQHPDFYLLGDAALQIDRLSYNVDWTTDPAADSRAGHGNLNAAIVAGYNQRSGPAYEDANGFNYGLGINPFGRLGGSKVFNNLGGWDLPNDDYPALVAQTYNLGGRISTNSWGADSRGAYTLDDQVYDALARDAAAAQPGNQPMILVFSAGNEGPDASSSGSPGNAKNVISVGASENVRPTWTDGCNVGPDGADDAREMANFSSRGPTLDGRVKPDLVAPGTHIIAAAAQAPGYNGTGVCDRYHPDGQTLYAASSGTSHAAPAVAGAASLLYRYYSDHFGGQPPSPAMTKAYLVNAARYLTGQDGEALPSPAQGFGRLDLGRAFDAAPRILVDQSQLLSAVGQVYSLRGQVADPARPLRVTLAWTDAPGATTGAAYVNDLDLELELGGQTYRGNVFQGEFSKPGGEADPRNNLESVFLPAGQSGEFTLRVRAANLPGDGVPGNDGLTDQDFALVVYNGLEVTGYLQGRARDGATSQPLPGTVVQARLPGLGGERVFRTQADASGAYSLSLPAGTYAASAWKYGYQPAQAAGLVIQDRQSLEWSFSLAPAAVYRLNGCVADQSTGQGLSASLTIRGPLGDLVRQVNVTQAQPCYSQNLAAGTYQFTVESQLHETFLTQVELTGNQVLNFTLQATTSQGLLFGRVTSALSKAGLPNAAVNIQASQSLSQTATYTAQDGSYETLLPPGAYTLTVSAPFYAPAARGMVNVPQSNLARQDFSLSAAALVASPAQGLWLHLEAGQSLTRSLTIQNQGQGTLSYRVYGVRQPTIPTASDASGYRLLDSRRSNGARYEWVDLTGADQALVGDDGEATLSLPFFFTLYGRTSNLLRVGNNGAALFGVSEGEVEYSNSSLNAAVSDHLIAPLWDDLDSSAGWIAYQTLGEAPNRRFVVLWYMRPHFSKVGNVTFQMILYEGTNNLKFQYQDVEFGSPTFDLGASATVGVRGQGPYYLQAGYNTPWLANQTALCFQAPGAPPCDPEDLPWLRLADPAGTLAEGQSRPVGLTVDAAGLSEGAYRLELWIASNDPTRQPALALPLRLVVGSVRMYLPLAIHR